MSFYKKILIEELESRRVRNARYSLRAFSQKLGLSPGLVSQLISGKKPLTHKSAQIISERLELNPQESQRLFDEVASCSSPTRDCIEEQKVLSVDEFKMISDWEYFAVLALAGIEGCRWRPDWISKRLNISVKRATEVMERLFKAGLIKKRGTSFQQTGSPLTTSQDVSSVAIRKYHKQNLVKAEESLSNHSVDERYFGSATFAMNPDDMDRYKKLLRRFRDKIASKSEKGQKKRVYHLSLQLFPVDDM